MGQSVGKIDRRVATNFLDASAKDSEGETKTDTVIARDDNMVIESIRPCTAPVVGARPPPLPPSGGLGFNRGYPSSGPPVSAPLPGQKLRSSRANRIDDVLTASREASPDVVNIDVRDPAGTLHMLTVHAEALRRRLETMQMERENLRFQVRLLERGRRETQADGLAAQAARLEEENRTARAVDMEHEDLQRRIADIDAELANVSCPMAIAAGAGFDMSKPAQQGQKRSQADGEQDEDETVAELRWENKLLVKRLQQVTRTGEQTHQDMLRTQLQSGLKSQIEAVGAASKSDDPKVGGSDSDTSADAEINQLLAQNEA